MKKINMIIIGICLVYIFGFSNLSGEEPFETKYYDNAKVFRVKYTQGEAFVKRSFDEGFEEATINLPIFEKDRVGTTQGRIGIYLGRSNYLRLDYDTDIEFEKIPELRKTNMAVRINRGGVYLDIENLSYERDIEIQTADCGIFLLDKGLYRINVSGKGETEVYVYEGIAEVSGKDYSRNVRENQKIVMSDGGVKDRPFYFYASDMDDFDKWNKQRNRAVGYARYSSSLYLEEDYKDAEYELSRNGRWSYNASYGCNIWIPYNVGLHWSPYYHGRWVWTPFYGYVWTSYDSWGYFTHHYGRWHWDPFSHWHWIPGYHWSPAWVSWFWDDYYYGWCPINRYNRPLIIVNNRWLRNYNYRHGIPFHSRSAVIIKKNQLSASRIHKVALRGHKVGFNTTNKTVAFKGFSPKNKAHISKVNVINAQGKSVVYKNSGFLGSRYKLSKSSAGASKLGNKSVYKYSGSNISSKKIYKYSTPGISKTTGKDLNRKISTSKQSTSTYKSRSTSKGTSKYKPKSSSKTKSVKKTSSGSSSKKAKKKDSPSYLPSTRNSSYKTSSSSNYYNRSNYSYKPSSANKYYKPSTRAVKSTSPSKSFRYLYTQPSYNQNKAYNSSSSYNYSRPKSYSSTSSGSYSRPSSRSYSRPSSGSYSRPSSSRSYSRPSSGSYSRSSSSRSSSRSYSGTSSSRSSSRSSSSSSSKGSSGRKK